MPSTVVHVSLADSGLVLWAEKADAAAVRGLAIEHFDRLGSRHWQATRIAAAGRFVHALVLGGSGAVEFLQVCAGRETIAPGVTLGEDVAYWCSALRLGAEIVVAQRFLPGIAYDKAGGVYRAVWEPILGDRERELFAGLAASMPSICRAMSAGKARSPMDAPATLERFLRIAVDAIVRAAAATPVRANDALPLHDRWMMALRDPDSELRGTPAELRTFAAQVESWRRAIVDEHAAEHRLCLRVEEPGIDEGAWRIVYLLQNRNDPTFLIDVKAAWQNPRLRRTLLASLGRAAQLSPHIESALRTSSWGFELDTEGAYAFLSETAWLLQQSGIGLILPSWWLGKDTKTRLVTRARVKPPAVSAGLRVDSLLSVNWRVAIGDASLTRREIEQLAELKVPLVRIRGRWVHVDRTELHRALDRMRSRSHRITVAETVQMQRDSSIVIEAQGDVAALMDRLQGRRSFEELAPPPGLSATLRPYQMRGYSWLGFLSGIGFGACLADDMGLGKTIQTLSLILRDRRDGVNEPVLLVCPTSVIGNWLREAQRFTPELAVTVHHGSDRFRDGAFQRHATRHAIVLTSYALLPRDVALFKDVSWRGVVLDEAQNVKNPESKQAQAARSLTAAYRVALTGTPVENHVGDLWSIMEFLNPGMLGSHASFKREFLIPIQAMRDPDAAERLRSLTGPFILRRLKSDPAIIADLPSKNEMKVFCTLTREQATLYAAVLRHYEEGLQESKGMQRRGNILAMLSKLKQVCNHPALFAQDRSPTLGRSGKLARLEDMLEEMLDVGERALIFTQFSQMGELLANRLTERFAREVLFLHGGTPKKRRDEMVERFAGERGPSLFVLSLKAGGSGLNLTRANHVFHFDRWWNPAVENQATDRAFRIGQTKNVQVRKFVCAGTLEERIDALIEHKRDVAENVVGTGEAWLTELSNAQLRELVALSADAVEE
jgi:SNF2 family DNA or RNA helicase